MPGTGQSSGLSTEELEVLRAVDRVGGEGHFQVIKRLVLPYRPRVIEEMIWSLAKAGYLELAPYTGIVKLTEKGDDALGRIRWKKKTGIR